MSGRRLVPIVLVGLIFLGVGCNSAEPKPDFQTGSAASQPAAEIPRPTSRHPDLPPLPPEVDPLSDVQPAGTGDPNDATCTAKTGESMTLGRAKEIGRQDPECADLLGEFEGGGMCNYQSETWWVTIKPASGKEKAGCNPACVIQVVPQEAEVNWRCTGLIPE